MREAVLHPLPRRGDVVREQLLTVALSLRREAAVVAGFAGAITVGVLWAQAGRSYGIEMPLTPDAGIPVAMLALLVPLAVWKAEGPAQRGYHHAMPVQHGAHAVVKALSGLVWLLALVAAYFAWVGMLSAVTGGSVESAPAWRWVAPFAGVTVMYLLGSALALKVAHAWRWIGGGLVSYLFLGALRGADGPNALYRLVQDIAFGPLGVSTVISGQMSTRHGWNGEYFAYSPNASAWLAATWLWLAIAVTLFVWAAYRQPER
jgi:hypothetical protein